MPALLLPHARGRRVVLSIGFFASALAECPLVAVAISTDAHPSLIAGNAEAVVGGVGSRGDCGTCARAMRSCN